MLTNLEALRLLLAEALHVPDPVVGRDALAFALAAVVTTDPAARDAGVALAREKLASARPALDRPG